MRKSRRVSYVAYHAILKLRRDFNNFPIKEMIDLLKLYGNLWEKCMPSMVDNTPLTMAPG